ncbi:Receptor-type tyrosine-protein phosphatase alpha [Exaiptasia diaphana]|nr:Receptor-type tyrosine-protein phosphatase alpha [Exaiptasia diaphana]
MTAEIAVRHDLKTIQEARFIRFVPVDYHVCKTMRVNVFFVNQEEPRVDVITPFERSIFVQWTIQPCGKLTQLIAGYLVDVSTKGKLNVSSTITSKIITGLQPYTEYKIRVKAVPYGLWSDNKTTQTDIAVPQGIQSVVTLKTLSPNSISVTWKHPQKYSINGPSTGYRVTYTTNKGQTKNVDIGVVNTWNITSLEKCTWYSVTVSVKNSKYIGPPSKNATIRIGNGCIERSLVGENRLIIPNSAYTASSFLYDSRQRRDQVTGKLYWDRRYVPHGARLYSPFGWSPRYNHNPEDYLQLDLGAVRAITAVATQGNGKSTLNEWTKTFKLRFKQDTNSTKWIEYGDILQNCYMHPQNHSINGPLTGYRITYTTNKGQTKNVDIGVVNTWNITSLEKCTWYSVTVSVNNSKYIGPPSKNSTIRIGNDEVENPTWSELNPILFGLKCFRPDGTIDECYLKEEFKSVPPKLSQYQCIEAEKPSNMKKNRYKNIFTYDRTRVFLKPESTDSDYMNTAMLQNDQNGSTSDYINASFVQGYDGSPNTYIATQGPLPDTTNDFWRMIWDQNTATIVMLTNVIELGKRKCHQYWPESSQQYGNITVNTIKVEVFADYVIRSFSLYKDQYKFVYLVVYEALACGNTEIQVENLNIAVRNLSKIDNSTNQSFFMQEFQRLNAVTSTAGSPMDDHRRVKLNNKEKTGEYINATYVDTYRERDAYIVTQSPTCKTVEEFWRLVMDHGIGTIVMLSKLQENNQTFHQYWPNEKEMMTCDNIKVKQIKVEYLDEVTVRTFQVINSTKSVDVVHLQHTDWKDKRIPSNPQSILNLLNEVQKSQHRFAGQSPVLVHCSNGVGRSGTFCSIASTLERVKQEQVLDVFQTVKSVRESRRGAVETLDQYKFCYTIVQNYLQSFSNYDNFKGK